MSNVSATETSIIIAGAGIGGLSLALGLAQQGFRPRVYEQAPAVGEVGAGISISPNATRGLEWLGLRDFLLSRANEPLTQWTHHGETGEDLLGIDRNNCRDEYGAAYYQLHRADLHNELLRRCQEYDPEMLVLGACLVGVENANDRPTALIDTATGKSTRVSADVLIGADGVRSTVRDAVFGAGDINFTGQAAWRGLIPAAELPDWATEAVSHNWIGPGRTFVTYPIRGRELVNFVAFARTDEWFEESWSTPAQPGEIRRAFNDWCEPVMTVLDAMDSKQSFRWGLFSRDPLESLVSGEVALIGDAAHPMLPFFGQGASSSIEDGVVLGRCFAASASAAEALKRYDHVRTPRVTHLQRESNLGAQRLQGLDPYVLRDQPVKNEDSLGIFRYDPVGIDV
ncbi:MAG: FAD-dependent monooxygenase [Congregibacter sp.]